MMSTQIGVSNLTDHMINKYGLILGIVLLKQQYGYIFKYNTKNKELLVTDDNPTSNFNGQKYKLHVYINDKELNGLKELLG